jgi:hypothetical protein
VIAGVEHQPVDASAQRFVNEAIVVDATGTELTRYRKLQEFYLAELGAGERLGLGDQVLLLSTFAGTFAVVICIDCFAAPVKQRIRASWTSVILVPSMSPKTSAHRAAAADLAGDGFQMVVANWWVDGPLAGPFANRRTWAAKSEAMHTAANSFARSMPGGKGEHDPTEVSGPVLHVCYPNGT